MKYICENNHLFEHSGKVIRSETNEYGLTTTTEKHCCPICESLVYSEYVLEKKKITSLISVNLSEVDSKIKEGYEVEASYAKTATLVKRE